MSTKIEDFPQYKVGLAFYKHPNICKIANIPILTGIPKQCRTFNYPSPYITESRSTKTASGPILNKRSTTLRLDKKPCFSLNT